MRQACAALQREEISVTLMKLLSNLVAADDAKYRSVRLGNASVAKVWVDSRQRAVLLAVGFVVTGDGERAELAASGTEREIREAGGRAQQAYSLLQGRLDHGSGGGGGERALAVSNRPSGACAPQSPVARAVSALKPGDDNNTSCADVLQPVPSAREECRSLTGLPAAASSCTHERRGRVWCARFFSVSCSPPRVTLSTVPL